MKSCSASEKPSTGRRSIAWAMALAVAFAVSMAEPARAEQISYGSHGGHITPPPVPGEIVVPEGSKAFLVGHAIGTQNYVCLPSGAAFAWNLFTPQATLFEGNEQLTTHFFSPNPDEKGNPVRAAWEHSVDSGIVWGAVVQPSSDPAFVAPGAIPWLLIKKVGFKSGPRGQHGRSGRGVLSVTTSIQRLNTSGGSAPATGCSAAADVGAKAFVPYTADYFFFYLDENADDN